MARNRGQKPLALSIQNRSTKLTLYPMYYRSLIYFFLQLTCGELSKLSQGTVCNVVKEMSVKLVTHFPQFVNFPANNDMPAVHEKFYALKQFPGVSGCVDGTHIPIYSPGGENAEIYR
uniref:Nuclease HARBI1 n=1 Tax=Cacopsylla melanoneura TaxID=428564 RepID=A0A8D8YIG4_9HEMI